MNKVITRFVNGRHIAYEWGNAVNQAKGASEEIAKKNLMEKQNSSPEKVVEGLKQYLKEIEKRMDDITKYLENASTELEYAVLNNSWEELARNTRTIEELLGSPNA